MSAMLDFVYKTTPVTITLHNKLDSRRTMSKIYYKQSQSNCTEMKIVRYSFGISMIKIS